MMSHPAPSEILTLKVGWYIQIYVLFELQGAPAETAKITHFDAKSAWSWRPTRLCHKYIIVDNTKLGRVSNHIKLPAAPRCPVNGDFGGKFWRPHRFLDQKALKTLEFGPMS